MKYSFIKIFLFSAIGFCSIKATSQATKGFQGGFDYVGNTISFKLNPLATTTTNFSTIEFFVTVPSSDPVFTWGALNSNTTNFPGIGTGASGFFLDPAPPVVPLFRVYHFIYTAPSPVTTLATYTAGSPAVEVFNVTIDVSPSTLDMKMVHSPLDEDPYYLAVTDGGGLELRPQDNGNVLQENSYFFPSTDAGSDPYFVHLAAFSAPVFLQDFNVTKKGTTDALLSWTTSQEQNVDRFILERSASQNNGWTKIGELKAKGNSNTPTKYSYTDLKAYDGISPSKVLFYRIRAIDIDNTQKIFPIRSLKFNATGKEISIYPNPAKEGFTISIPIVNPGNKMIRLNMVNRLGQVVHAREIPAASASNYYYDIKTPGIVTGEYMLQIIYDGALLDTKKVIVQL